MDYYVHVDLYDAVGPTVHKAGCRLVRHRRPATTTRWDGPFILREARRAAAGRAHGHPIRATPHCCGGLGPPPT